MKFFECPECGTEILEAEACPSCDGSGNIQRSNENNNKLIYVKAHKCYDCDGTGKSNDYYCPHCDWKHEE